MINAIQAILNDTVLTGAEKDGVDNINYIDVIPERLKAIYLEGFAKGQKRRDTMFEQIGLQHEKAEVKLVSNADTICLKGQEEYITAMAQALHGVLEMDTTLESIFRCLTIAGAVVATLMPQGFETTKTRKPETGV